MRNPWIAVALSLILPSVARATDVMGTLAGNTTWTPAGNPYNVTGDLTVPSGVTLTLEAGVQVKFASTDAMGSGADSSKVELIVNGTLAVQGTSASHVTLTQGNGYGIRVNGSATFDYADLSGGLYGVFNSGNTTANNSSFQGSGYCLFTTGGSLTFNNGSLTGCTQYALNVDGGTTQLSYSLVKGSGLTGNNAAIFLDAVASISHNTIVENYRGIAINSGTSAVTIIDNVITSNGAYGVDFYSSSTPSRTFHHNNVWGHSASNLYNVGPGTGGISANPLFVGSGNYRITENSPARMAASDGSDMGAFAYAGDATSGLQGTLFSNKTLTGANTVTGDLTVRSGVTLTLAAGASLTYASTDAMKAGTDSSKVELIVNGTLAVQGTSASHVTLTQGNGYGIRVNGSATFDYADLSGGLYGVFNSGNTTANNSSFQGSGYCLFTTGGSLTFTNGSLTGCTQYALNADGGTTQLSYSLVKGSGLTGNNAAIFLDAVASISHNTIVENYRGIAINSGTSAVTIIDNVITSNGAYGVDFYSSSTPSRTFHHNNVWGHSASNLYNVGPGTGGISANPLFVSPGFNYTLQETSPCRNAASDGTDMGAFPYAPVPVARVEITPAAPSLQVKKTQQFTATAYDAANNPLPTATITWSASAAAGSITSGGLFTAGCTPGTFTGAITASSGGKSGTATVTLTTGPVASVTVSPGSVTLQPGDTQQFTAAVKDACGNSLSDPVGWSVASGGGSISTSGLFTAGTTTGTFTNTVKATSGSISGHASVTVQSNALASIVLSPSTASLPINGTQQFTATGKDASGNTVSVNVTWSVVNGGGTIDSTGLFTAGTTAGTFTDTVKATSGSIVAYASVTVEPGPLASIKLSPMNTTLSINGTRKFTATGKDSAGNTVPVTVTWSVVNGGGTINSTGLFTAGTTPGTFTNTVKATSGSISGYSTVVVQPGPLASIEVSPSTASIGINGTQQFTATGKDSAGNVVPATVTWAVVNGGGTINSTGLFTAGTTPGNFTNTVRAESGSISGFASVSVQSGSLSTIVLSPSTATLPIGGTQQFTATGKDSAGNTVSVNVTWSVVSGGGTIDSTGLFTAGSTPGAFTNTVKATSGGISAFATVTVQAGALASIEVSPATATLPTHGTQLFTATGRDSAGNTVPVNVIWSVASGGGTIDSTGLFTAGSAPGTFTNTVKATSGGISGNATVVITGGAVARVEVSPANPTVAAGGTIAFTARAFDAANHELTGLTASWAVVNGGGTLTSAGVFTAGTESGVFTDTVKATVGGVSATTSVTISEDFDHDGLPDAWEVAHGLDPTKDDSGEDPDQDAWVNTKELEVGTDPHDADSDDDGVVDGNEQKPGEDTDGDSLANALDPDSDGDGLFDGTEMAVAEPHKATDPNQDHFIPDADPSTSTDPLAADTDQDSRSDGQEDLNRNGRVDPLETDPNTPDVPCLADADCGASGVCDQGQCKAVGGIEATSGCGCTGGSGAPALGLLVLAIGLIRSRRSSPGRS